MKNNITFLSEMTKSIYGLPDDRLYDMEDMFYYHQKWLLRSVDDSKLSKKNILVALAWFFSIVNRFQIDLEKTLQKRYSYKCPFCLEMPCYCDQDLERKSQKTGRPGSGKIATIKDWQILIEKIYPENSRLIDALIRNQDALHQVFRRFRRDLAARHFKEIEVQSADYFVLLIRYFNQEKIDIGHEYLSFFRAGCFVCKKVPCKCLYSE